MDKETIDKILLCKDNARYFLENLLWIEDKQTGKLIRFTLNHVQSQVYDKFWEAYKDDRPFYAIILKARKMGVSTLIDSLAFWYVVTNPQYHAIIMAHSMNASGVIHNMTKRFYANLPDWFRPQKKYSNKTELDFRTADGKGLNSKLSIGSPDTEAQTRAPTYRVVHASEVSRWPADAEGIMLGLVNAVPQKAPRTMIVQESTANGRNNYFYRKWKEAEEGTGDFQPIFLPWFADANYSMRLSRKEAEEGLFPKYDDEEEYLVKIHHTTPEQLKWRRWAIKNLCESSITNFHQEYPAEAEEAFITSSKWYFDPVSSKRAEDGARIIFKELVNKGDLIYKDRENILSDLEFIVHDGGILHVWKGPEKDHEYISGADTSEGGPHADWSTSFVFDRKTNEIVAMLRTKIDPDEFAAEYYRLGRWYNCALLAPERKGSGNAVIRYLQTMGYPNLYYQTRLLDGMPTKFIGWETDVASKPTMLSELKKWVRLGLLICPFPIFWHEALNFVRDEKSRRDTGSAKIGQHDDCVMAMAITIQVHVSEFQMPHSLPNEVPNPPGQLQVKNGQYCITKLEERPTYDEHLGEI